MVAIAGISRVRLILTDEPIVVIDTTIDDSTALYQLEREGDTRVIRTAVEVLKIDQLIIFRNLHGSYNIRICE